MRACRFCGKRARARPRQFMAKDPLLYREYLRRVERQSNKTSNRIYEEVLRVLGGRAVSYKEYELLGIMPGCGLEAAKKAYRQAMHKVHPDVGGSDDEAASINRAWRFVREREA